MVCAYEHRKVIPINNDLDLVINKWNGHAWFVSYDRGCGSVIYESESKAMQAYVGECIEWDNDDAFVA